MEINADLHIHSRFSISVSKAMTVKNLVKEAPLKGIDLIGCGDCLHKAWFSEVTDLPEVTEGTFELGEMRFLLTGEVEDDHRVHHVLLFPSRSAVEEFRARVQKHSKNLHSDGRPNIHLGGEEIAQIAKDVEALIGPAHAFTPWTAMYAAHDSLKDCYGELEGYISFLELGLSADTSYADRISELQRLTFLTNSDAHSPRPKRIAREFNRLDIKAVSAKEVFMALRRQRGRKVILNVGLPPELGKYNESACISCYKHYYLEEASKLGWKCKECGKRIKKGVWDRVNELANFHVPRHPPYRSRYIHIIPLTDIISDALGKGPDTKTVNREWTKLIEAFKNEVNILVDAPLGDVADVAQDEVGNAIRAFREGKVIVYPGGGGDYGKISVPRPGQRQEPPRPKKVSKIGKAQYKLDDF